MGGVCHTSGWTKVCSYRCKWCEGWGSVFHVVKEDSCDFICSDCGKDYDLVAYCVKCKHTDYDCDGMYND
jgi:hypothetical protein